MNLQETFQQLRDDIKIWVTNNINALNAKIDEKTIPIDQELNLSSTNPIQNKAVASEVNKKVDKVDGKGLSTNDFTDEEKAKLAALDPDAATITVDSALSTTSENPVQNKVINAALTNKSDSDHKHAAADITSGTLSTDYGGTGNNTGRITKGHRTDQTIGTYATAEGWSNVASGKASHAEGYATSAFGEGAHVEGYGTVTGKSVAYGRGSHAEGMNTTAGASTIAANTACAAHAEGYNTVASATYSHAEGYQANATANAAHAEGTNTNAGGDSAHAEGSSTTASGAYSHAEGASSKATAMAAHAEGYGTEATSLAQHTQGRYNVLDTQGNSGSIGKYVHIVGNGTSNTARSNAHTLDWDGNAWFAGDVYVGLSYLHCRLRTYIFLSASQRGCFIQLNYSDWPRLDFSGADLTNYYTKTETDTAINTAINAKIYVQAELPPDNAPIGAIWIDTNTTAITSAEGVEF